MVWELRSVNHRYLDVQLRLPDEVRALETQLRGALAAVAARGKVEASLRLRTDGGSDARIHIDTARLEALKKALGQVASELNIDGEPDLMRILSWPGVITDAPVEQTPIVEAVQASFDEALAAFTATREDEGARIARHINERIAAMRELVETVRKRGPQVRDAWVERLRERCAELGVEVEPARLAQEVALVAQRLDVDEEMSRLKSHLDEVEATLKRDEPVGRRLDFLMQELNREANTLSSKSQDEQMTQTAVEMKVLIEQMREQVQNVE